MEHLDEADKKIIQHMAQLKTFLTLAQHERDHYKQMYGEINFLMLKILQGQPKREYRIDREDVGSSLDPTMYKLQVYNDKATNELVIKLLGIDEEIDAHLGKDDKLN